MADEVLRWREIHKRKNTGLLFAEDLGPPGTTIDVWIDESGRLKVTDLDGDTEMPYIAKRGAKKLGLNRGNCKTLETITGTDNVMAWRGWFTLVVIRAKYKDRKTKETYETSAIRIAPKRPDRSPLTAAAARPSNTTPDADELAIIAAREAEEARRR